MENQNQSQLKANFITEKDISALWETMTSAFGSKWVNQFGVRDSGFWFESLNDLTIAEVKQGLKAMVTTGNEWPPTLPEFRKYCLIGNSKLPDSNEEWQKLGDSMGIRAGGGESWGSYISRIKTSLSRADAHNYLRLT